MLKPRRSWLSGTRAAALVVLLLLAAYHTNGDFLVGNDSRPNAYLPVVILESGRLTFAPGDRLMPWPEATDRIPDPAAPYYLVETRQRGRYVGAYGPGPGLLALPAFAVLSALPGSLRDRPARIWYGAKFVAALLTAASAGFLLLAAQRVVDARLAWGLALFYGLGTGAFSTASQALTQHPAVLFFVSAALWLQGRADSRGEVLAGLALGAAVFCRPQSVLLLAPVGLALAMRRRALPLAFGIGASLPIACLLAFNACTLGNPLRTGQAILGARFAQTTTGSPELWQTPWIEGLAGLLISPSRGLLVFTPAFVFAFAGAWIAWRDHRWLWLRPWSVGVLLLLLLCARYFNWWGGWSFGYRYLLDAVPVLVLLMLPALAAAAGRPVWRGLLGVLVVWSVAVQLVGAFLYDVGGWNGGRSGDPVGTVARDVDFPQNRDRLWSLRDSQLVYSLTRAPQARAARRAEVDRWLSPLAP